MLVQTAVQAGAPWTAVEPQYHRILVPVSFALDEIVVQALRGRRLQVAAEVARRQRFVPTGEGLDLIFFVCWRSNGRDAAESSTEQQGVHC